VDRARFVSVKDGSREARSKVVEYRGAGVAKPTGASCRRWLEWILHLQRVAVGFNEVASLRVTLETEAGDGAPDLNRFGGVWIKWKHRCKRSRQGGVECRHGMSIDGTGGSLSMQRSTRFRGRWEIYTFSIYRCIRSQIWGMLTGRHYRISPAAT
jgi:hypothetical protein